MHSPEVFKYPAPEWKRRRNEVHFGGFCIRHGFSYSGGNCDYCIGEQTTICEFVEQWTSLGSSLSDKAS